MKQLYDTAKKLAGKYSKPERPVKDNSVTDGWNTSRNS
ncbi:unnamed protein product [Schistosoma mattheei]|uniref:Uncharacterized protein n=1 Tax=Schistosoma mattheei TaxID=31246 RepID=A0A183P6Y5_9TREM|nr:unnamed protein product [Schistosoma mattheei]